MPLDSENEEIEFSVDFEKMGIHKDVSLGGLKGQKPEHIDHGKDEIVRAKDALQIKPAEFKPFVRTLIKFNSQWLKIQSICLEGIIKRSDLITWNFSSWLKEFPTYELSRQGEIYFSTINSAKYIHVLKTVYYMIANDPNEGVISEIDAIEKQVYDHLKLLNKCFDRDKYYRKYPLIEPWHNEERIKVGTQIELIFDLVKRLQSKDKIESDYCQSGFEKLIDCIKELIR